ncbi:MmyB family transcriptional regulator [Kitasatospora sp. CB01950]|uniref:MmyB family transcriptional regulator n=1 Tax=Kitasatospora sp. CB01950 TaxID=1703930 RepID=UPI003FCC418D
MSTRSEEFRTLWAARDVHVFRTGVKRFRHPAVGELELDHESRRLPGENGLSVVVYSAAPGSAADDALALLAGRSATAGPQQRIDAPTR